VSERVREERDVGTRGLRDLGHGVDERDLRGEEGVRRALDELGGRQIGHDERGSRLDRGLIDLAQHIGGAFAVVAGRNTHHEAIRRDRVLHRPPLAEELGIPRQGRPANGQLDGQTLGGSHRHRRLSRDHIAPAQVGEEGGDRRIHESEIGGMPSQRMLPTSRHPAGERRVAAACPDIRRARSRGFSWCRW